MIEAKIILDSINPLGCRLTTWILTYPRIIHAELMTHRMFSRNSSSSRAIPVEKMIREAEINPFIPEKWPVNQKGMQASSFLEDEQEIYQARAKWLKIRDDVVSGMRSLLDLNIHKQIANRPLEAFSHITVLLSATDYENFFSLRAEEHAQPEFQTLSFKMLDLYNASEPRKLIPGEWHIPFGDKMEAGLSHENMLKVAVARAARVSYNSFDGVTDIVKDIRVHDDLAANGHFSCFEHTAMCANNDKFSGNLQGYIQYRKTLPMEKRTDSRVLKKKPSQYSYIDNLLNNNTAPIKEKAIFNFGYSDGRYNRIDDNYKDNLVYLNGIEAYWSDVCYNKGIRGYRANSIIVDEKS